MPRKSGRNTKGRIVSAAWKLFYEQGYENTTVEDIIFESETSKGSFYHYFDGKDALLGSLSMIFDEKYEELREVMDPDMSAPDALLYLNHELFAMIDNSVSLELLARLLSSQLVTRGERHLLDRNRTYFKLLHQIVKAGQERGELRADVTANEIVTSYAMFERALMYDWCLNNGSYALSKYAADMMPMLLQGYCVK
ncbi:MAG: TetR/AcrR family transcriptional regulator [Oscillospiraceae bacterium]